MPVGLFVNSRTDYYYNGSYTVANGVTDQELDISAALVALGRDATDALPKYLKIISDYAVTVKVNSTSLAALPINDTSGYVLPADILDVSTLYFSNSSGSTATLAIIAI